MVSAENVVHDLINETLVKRKAKQKNVNIKPIYTEGANFTSVLYSIQVVTEEENLDLFAKVALIAGEMRQQMHADWMYKTELFVYHTLMQIYEGLQDKYNIPEEQRYVFSKCYAIDHKQGQETVVLENLTSKGYKSYNRFESMDWEHAAISVDLLAKFHALSFAYAKDNPEEFKELCANMVQRGSGEDKGSEQMFSSVWDKIVDRSLDLIDAEHRNKLRNLMMKKDFVQNYNKPSERVVLCHGDYRLSNILFRREGEILHAVPIDYQMVHSGCPPGDLLYFIFMGSDEEFRRQHFNRLVDHYYECLCQALRRFDLNHVEVYPRETFDKHMKEVFPYVLYNGASILPLVMVDANSLPRVGEEIDVSTFVVKTTPLYASRFQGIVNDCIRLGVI